METKEIKRKNLKNIDNSRKSVFCYTSKEVDSISKIKIIDGKKTMALQDYAKYVGKTRQTIYNWLKIEKIKSIEFGYQQFIIVN